MPSRTSSLTFLRRCPFLLGFFGQEMADEENVRKPAAMDLNLYLGLPRCSRPRSLDLGSDLSLNSLPLPSSSNSGESRAPEAASGAMEASASHAPYSLSHASIGEADVPSVCPWSPGLENPMRPYFDASCVWEAEGPSASYSLSNARGLQIEQVAVDPAERDEQHHFSFDAIFGLHPLVANNSVHGEGLQTRCSPTYPPPSADFPDEPLLQSPDFRIRRLIESHGWRQSSFGQYLYGLDMNSTPSSSPSPEQFMPEATSLQPNGKKKATAESIDESSENGDDEKNKCSTNFDCNICFDISKEPVVTSCGHLFCWPCLYQWLHLYSEHKECPVCKGEVIEANITPIYGRGSSGSDMESKFEESEIFCLLIPPRPRGHRLESWREQFYQISPRVAEGITNSTRSALNHPLNGGRSVAFDGGFVQEIINRGPPAVLTRPMIRSLQGITESGPSTQEIGFTEHGELLPIDGVAVPVQDEIYTGNEIHSFIAMNFGIGRAGGGSSENSNRHRLSSSVNAPTPDQFCSVPINGGRHVVDQASASSTVAMISGENSVRDAPIELNGAGSSRSPRTIRGCSAASSSDDGGNLCSHKRRRLH